MISITPARRMEVKNVSNARFENACFFRVDNARESTTGKLPFPLPNIVLVVLSLVPIPSALKAALNKMTLMFLLIKVLIRLPQVSHKLKQAIVWQVGLSMLGSTEVAPPAGLIELVIKTA